MNNLINQLINQGYLKTPRIIKAFQKIERKDFLRSRDEEEAEINAPLSIGEGQTISQPLTVAFMIELLMPGPGNKILDIGSGSGWTTALLAEIVGDRGMVWAIERILELKEFGESNVRKYNFIDSGRVEFFCQDGTKGLPEKVPFDRILVSAAAEEIPPPLKEQLKIGGRMVIPVGNDIVLLERVNKIEYKEKKYHGFVFVPLIKGKDS